MPLRPFIDTHIHSHYSLLDGVSSPTDNVLRAKALGMEALAISDHGTVAGIFEHYEACRNPKLGGKAIVPLLGNELFFKETLMEGKKESKYFHGVFLAMNDVGFKNLLKLSSIGWQEGHYEFSRPIVSIEEILQHSEGLVFSTGCMIGIVGVSRHLTFEESDALFARFAHHFQGRMFVELGPAQVCFDWKRVNPDTKEHGWVELPPAEAVGLDDTLWTSCLQSQHNLRAQRLALKYQLPMIIASDAHMASPDLKHVQDMLISGGSSSRWHFHQTHAMLSSDETWGLMQQNHSYVSSKWFEGMIDNTYQVMDLCKDLVLKPPALVPTYTQAIGSTLARSGHPAWKEGMTTRELLHAIVKYNGRLQDNATYRDRYAEEVRVICDNGVTDYTDYFLILEDIVSAAKRLGVGVGPGRGSAGGCLLSYLLGITAIDPIKWNLTFTRFLNEGRLKAGSPPDIDLDFSDRDKMVDYVFERYGAEHVAMVGSFLTIKTKNALKDIARWKSSGHLDDQDPVHKVTASVKAAPQFYPDEKSFLHGFTDKVGNVYPAHLAENKTLREYLEQNPDVNEMLHSILAKPRSLGKHAGGIVITPGPIDEVVPTRYFEGYKVTQVDHKRLEKLGGMKIDLLGVNTLNFIWDAVALIKERHGVDIDPWDLPEEQAAFEPLWTGDASGIFQFDTHLITPFLRKIKPRKIHDLILITSICRPGGLDSMIGDATVAEHFVERYNGLEPSDYFDPILEPILNDTYGLIVFQEQIQRLFEVVGGLSPVESDNARRAVAKKDLALINSIQGQMISGASDNLGWTREKVLDLWKSFEGAANYSFNRAHACAYAIIAYACIYLKFHYPKEWWVSVLTSSDTEDVKRYLGVVHDQVQLPHVNSPAPRWIIQGEKLVAPLALVKGMGPKAVAHLLAEFIVSGPFSSFDNFYARVQGRVVHKGVIVSMCIADCFKGLPVIDGGEPTMETTPFLNRLYELRKEDPPPDQARMTRSDLIRRKMALLPIYTVDISKEFDVAIREAVKVTETKGIRLIAGRPLVADFARFTRVEKVFKDKEVALVGVITEKESFSFLGKSGRDEGKRVTAWRISLVNDGQTCEFVIWPSMAKKMNVKEINVGQVVLAYGLLRFDSFKGGIGFGLNTLQTLDV